MTDTHPVMDALIRAELEQGIITPEQIRAFIHPRQDSPLTGLEVFIVRMESRPEWICGGYSSMERAEQNKHRHQFGSDEIVSFIIDAPPLLYDGGPVNFEQT